MFVIFLSRNKINTNEMNGRMVEIGGGSFLIYRSRDFRIAFRSVPQSAIWKSRLQVRLLKNPRLGGERPFPPSKPAKDHNYKSLAFHRRPRPSGSASIPDAPECLAPQLLWHKSFGSLAPERHAYRL